MTADSTAAKVPQAGPELSTDSQIAKRTRCYTRGHSVAGKPPDPRIHWDPVGMRPQTLPSMVHVVLLRIQVFPAVFAMLLVRWGNCSRLSLQPLSRSPAPGHCKYHSTRLAVSVCASSAVPRKGSQGRRAFVRPWQCWLPFHSKVPQSCPAKVCGTPRSCRCTRALYPAGVEDAPGRTLLYIPSHRQRNSLSLLRNLLAA